MAEAWEWKEGFNNPIPFQLHYVTLEVAQPIVGGWAVGEKVAFTVIGNSPIDLLQSDTRVQVGDDIIAFGKATQIGWRNGLRPGYIFISSPSASSYIQSDDGQYRGGPDNEVVALDTLVSRIAQSRANYP